MVRPDCVDYLQKVALQRCFHLSSHLVHIQEGGGGGREGGREGGKRKEEEEREEEREERGRKGRKTVT